MHEASVAPVRERGLKLLASYNSASLLLVAPVRERGLKCSGKQERCYLRSRSREGAWIEIYSVV